MSPRRGATVSPLIGWSLNAAPSAVQSRRSPVSKSRLSGLPSAPTGRTPTSLSAGGWAGVNSAKESSSAFMRGPRVGRRLAKAGSFRDTPGGERGQGSARRLLDVSAGGVWNARRIRDRRAGVPREAAAPLRPRRRTGYPPGAVPPQLPLSERKREAHPRTEDPRPHPGTGYSTGVG